jgi:hypothetical protein
MIKLGGRLATSGANLFFFFTMNSAPRALSMMVFSTLIVVACYLTLTGNAIMQLCKTPSL